MVAALLRGQPMWFSYDLYQNFMSYSKYDKTATYSSTGGSRKLGGHATTLVGYGMNSWGQEQWIHQNSWGVGWGDNGYGYMLKGVDLVGCESSPGRRGTFAVYVEGGTPPPCLDSADSGWGYVGSPSLSCPQAKLKGFCTQPSSKAYVVPKCPKSCGTCTSTTASSPSPSAPAPSTPACVDSSTFTDPVFGDSCANTANGVKQGWYTCTAVQAANCPVACNACPR